MLKSRTRKTQTCGPPRKKIQLLRNQQISIADGDWKLGNYADVCSMLSQLNCSMLILQSNLDGYLLKSIQHIKFPNLKRLFLGRNLIQTIQPISRMPLPSLQYLDLIENRINSLKPLKRAFLPNLKVLHISNNPIYDSQFSIFAIFTPNLKAFSSDYFNFHDPIFEDVSCLVKLQSTKIEELYFDSYRRIIQKKVVDVLHRRFPNAELAQQLLVSESQELSEDDKIWQTTDDHQIQQQPFKH